MHPVKQRLFTALAEAYERSTAGRTGQTSRFFRIDFHDLVRAAACADGDALEVARAALAEAATVGVVRLRHPRRDSATITAVEFDPTREQELFMLLDRASPTGRRDRLAKIFAEAEKWEVPERWRASWAEMCRRFADAAKSGGALAPFSRTDGEFNGQLLRVSSRLLHWKSESLLRFASCQLFGNSKQLEQWRSALESALAVATSGEVRDLTQLGILDNPRSCIVCGPIILHVQDGAADLRLLRGPITLSIADLRKCVRIETDARRFCSVENPTTFHELAKLRSDTLFACTDGYAKPALFELVRRLNPALELFHFGDTDPAGFDILRHLRAETQRSIGSLHMIFRPREDAEPLSVADRVLAERLLIATELDNDEKDVLEQMLACGDKGDFEQERLGIPRRGDWPFY